MVIKKNIENNNPTKLKASNKSIDINHQPCMDRCLSPHNIKKDITKGIEEIRHAENLSTKRVDQLKNVKEVFASSKLASKANEIDKLISNCEKPMVALQKTIVDT